MNFSYKLVFCNQTFYIKYKCWYLLYNHIIHILQYYTHCNWLFQMYHTHRMEDIILTFSTRCINVKYISHSNIHNRGCMDSNRTAQEVWSNIHINLFVIHYPIALGLILSRSTNAVSVTNTNLNIVTTQLLQGEEEAMQLSYLSNWARRSHTAIPSEQLHSYSRVTCSPFFIYSISTWQGSRVLHYSS